MIIGRMTRDAQLDPQDEYARLCKFRMLAMTGQLRPYIQSRLPEGTKILDCGFISHSEVAITVLNNGVLATQHGCLSKLDTLILELENDLHHFTQIQRAKLEVSYQTHPDSGWENYGCYKVYHNRIEFLNSEGTTLVSVEISLDPGSWRAMQELDEKVLERVEDVYLTHKTRDRRCAAVSVAILMLKKREEVAGWIVNPI